MTDATKHSGSYSFLEVCVDNLASVRIAGDAGANRVELCAALSEGGLTPSTGIIKAAVDIASRRRPDPLLVNVIIRPRCGDFIYSNYEVDAMAADVEAARISGADGVVIGALTPEGDVDIDVCRRLICSAGNMNVTFHRAFDLCNDYRQALESIIDMGCDTLLTSGQHNDAISGAEVIADCVRRADNRIMIMAGSGVSPENAGRIIQQTGVRALHGSFRSNVCSSARSTANCAMGSSDSQDFLQIADAAKIRNVISAFTMC